MSTVQEIELAILKLSPEELARLSIAVDVRLAQLQSPVEHAISMVDLPPSDIQPAKLRSIQERAAAFQQWVDRHAGVTAVADDSRESIYEGRGE
jgi:hypothetical protein